MANAPKPGNLVCIQCAMKAIVEGTPVETFDETPGDHLNRKHSDLRETARERRDLEERLFNVLKARGDK